MVVWMAKTNPSEEKESEENAQSSNQSIASVDAVDEKGDIRHATSNVHPVKIQLDLGETRIKSRTSWWKIWIPRGIPPAPPASLDDAKEIPLTTASWLSILTYVWISPMMTLGYQRTLQATDLWKLDESHTAEVLSAKFDDAWEERRAKAQAWNYDLEKGLINPNIWTRFLWLLYSLAAGRNYLRRRAALEKQWRQHDGRKQPSIALALNDTLGVFFWVGGLFKVFGDTCQLLGPVLIRVIINFAKRRATAKANNQPGENVGIGIAMAVGLFALTTMASLGTHQFFWRSMLTGTLARGTLIKSIYKRGVNLTGKARTSITNSDITNHISTDVSRIDSCAQWFHAVWTAPIQISVCLIILCTQLGPSALAGFALFLILAPLQERAMAQQFQIRKKSMKYTDQRAKTLLEVLGSMRVVKYFSYETPFLDRIYETRGRELNGIKNILWSQSANVAAAFSLPVLAATLAFVTYTHVVPGFDVAIIFSSLSLFQLLRQPMMFLPRALSAAADARNALARLQGIFIADLRTEDALRIDEDLKWAVHVQNATFEWEESLSTKDADINEASNSASPFKIQNINMNIQRGSLVAVVGRVGSGKSSLLLGLIGEMRKTSGSVSFGGRVAYCPQTAWIQNSSLRDNIIFGQPFDEEKYWRVVETACLLHDLELLADGDLTEIGEKGVNLSGGQKQRINVARALYYDADIIIMDDPLSAVDAHVGKSLFHDAIVKSLRNQGKTVIFVTHALHFLSCCDYIYTLNGGRVAEQGTFKELVKANGEFARLDKEFGGGPSEEPQVNQSIIVSEDLKAKLASTSRRQAAAGTGKLEGKLIVKEHRSTGSISKKVYKAYFHAGKGFFTAPLLFLAIVLLQGSLITSSYTLVWWQSNTFDRPFSFYQSLYAGLGVAQAVFTFLAGWATDIFSYLVSTNLHHAAIYNIFHAPMSFFDTTPMGRIIGIFGKDIDNIDNQLPVSMRMLVLTISNVLGSVIIITVVEHYFLIVVVFVFFGYQYFAAFYRASAREVKRLDSMLRSLLYSHLSESLTGLPTLRTYGEIPRFLKENSYYIDLENRALFLNVTNQRWLSIRLDFCGALLVFFVALFAVCGVSGISAAQVGLILTYTTSLTQACGMLTRQTAEVENYLNSVERVVHYSQKDLLDQEAPHEIPEARPPPEWPTQGAIAFKNLALRYRPGLPNVLHGISLSIRGGEKIGIVGRTGAGKSSITLALLRIVEYQGLITIDGVDISKIGLKDLRTKVAIIPQDPTIFSGTVRTALDPFSMYDDARLWDALRRSYLVEEASQGEASSSEESPKITLDTVIEADGLNLSVGERSLLSLARALVRDTKVVILDEATASVDLETDQRIQQTIQTEFKTRTLICIAHRLRTILSYDRILVLDSGRILEFDSPFSLFSNPTSLFRGLCDKSNITGKDFF
ncbi:ABC protein [Pholiota conissans]|uniref:ABC protein n=1 Tax=Pholiota conissans TaxID=109636 RepID=A0A9P5ZCX2_9AGAR|nr:ABC protein [Pholiota conissans]